MTLSSMTGFARALGRHEGAHWAWELKSVNAKGLDLRLRLPVGCEALDSEVRRMLGTVIARGNVHASLELSRSQRAADVRVDDVLLGRLATQLRATAERQGLAPPGMDALMAVRGVVEIVEHEDSEASRDALHAAILGSLEEAIVALCADRQTEGAALSRILVERAHEMAGLVREAEGSPVRTPEAIRQRIARQVADLVGASDLLDPQRLHQEAVLLAVKADVREEIDRLLTHLAQAEALLSRGGAIGRRLDFLSQECGREINTLCAKAHDPALTSIGLSLKTLIEQFREQVQNVE